MKHRYWEIEFECDDSWSISGIYSFFMKQSGKPTEEDIKNVCGASQFADGLGKIVRVIEISEEEYYEECQ